jgi:hypothetical protein
MTNDEILNIKLTDCGGANTIRQYFAFIASEVWTQGEGFSGKHGIGGSDWQTDIYTALIKAGAVDGEIDDDGFITECDYDEADFVLKEAIESMGVEVRAEPKRKMVVFETPESPIGDHYAAAADPSDVSSITEEGGITNIRMRGGTGFIVDETIASVANKLGIELVESVECKQQ